MPIGCPGPEVVQGEGCRSRKDPARSALSVKAPMTMKNIGHRTMSDQQDELDQGRHAGPATWQSQPRTPASCRGRVATGGSRGLGYVVGALMPTPSLLSRGSSASTCVTARQRGHGYLLAESGGRRSLGRGCASGLHFRSAIQGDTEPDGCALEAGEIDVAAPVCPSGGVSWMAFTRRVSGASTRRRGRSPAA